MTQEIESYKPITPKEKVDAMMKILKRGIQQKDWEYVVREMEKMFANTHYIYRKPEPPRRDYFRQYYKMKAIRQQMDLEQDRREAKIEESLLRKNMWCFKCKKVSKVNPEKNSFEIKDLPRSNQGKIILKNTCEFCQNELKSFGGYITAES